jgi:2-polyprenyl-3-methyl-5-hydroxy-6-metoxy-1,4-benzoquinol methylase
MAKKQLQRFKGKKAIPNKNLKNYLVDAIQPNTTLLDIGCGPKLYSSPFVEICSRVLTIDAWDHVDPDILADLEKSNIEDLVNNEKFDYILMLDFIEHLSKSAGKKLIEDCKKICNKKIFLLTPLEEIWTDNHENVENEDYWCFGNSYDLHKSIWCPEDFHEWEKIIIPGFENYYVGSYSCAK